MILRREETDALEMAKNKTIVSDQKSTEAAYRQMRKAGEYKPFSETQTSLKARLEALANGRDL